MIAAMELAQSKYLKKKPESARKELGQYFTGESIANYMASMIRPVDKHTVRVLDAGAGTGILAISAALHCLAMGNNQVHAVLYEIDDDVIPLLEENLQQVKRQFQKQGGKFSFEIRHEDFVLSRPDKREEEFDISLINPPYFKYSSKTSVYSGATSDLFKGNPNIYASFMAVVASCLTPMGQMVAIVPRSFTNGLYFKGFRHYLNRTMSLDKIHVFRSRDKVFKELSVLQENIICSYTKRQQVAHIEVSTSASYEDISDAKNQCYSAALLIDKTNDHEIIRIPESSEDAQILKTVEEWPSTFKESGFFISTGPVVEHRARKYITRPEKMEHSVPLFRMHNVKPFEIVWTGKHKKDGCLMLLGGHEKHTTSNLPYVILKRFTSKEEKRRLVAGVHDPRTVKSNLIALENHLNYIGRPDGKLSLAEAYGLAALLNSTFMDRYFRCVSGNTQVNATEIRLLKLPTIEVIRQIGVDYMKGGETGQNHIDSMISSHLQLTLSPAA